MSIEILPVWKQTTPELQAELVEFWARHNAIRHAGVAGVRSAQVVCIARSEGQIVGVSTAVPMLIPRLRQPMYYYRTFVATPFRGQGVAAPLLLDSRAALQAWNQALAKPECIGVLLELENRSLAMHRNDAHWADVGFTFIGYSPRGLHLRVSYFDGARLQPPALRVRKAGAQHAPASIAQETVSDGVPATTPSARSRSTGRAASRAARRS